MPLRDLRGYLWDILQAAEEALAFVEGHTFVSFTESRLLRAAVERKLEFVGEALGQALKRFPEIAGHFPEAPRVVAMRNRLVHAYAEVDPAVVWGVVKHHLPELLEKVRDLLGSALPGDQG